MTADTPRVWLKAFWGFDPGNEGYVGFTRAGDRDSFIAEARKGDLVLIYGANSRETALKDKRQALGFLEVDPIPITDRERISTGALKRKLEHGWRDRWTFAVPVIRAWRVKRPIEVKYLAPITYIARNARVIAARGSLMTPEEARNALGLPVSQVSVFGEPPLADNELPEFALQSIFHPSRGINPAFGVRSSEYEDGVHFLYMLRMSGEPEAILDRPPGSLHEKVIIKVGYSRDPGQRQNDLNAALPPAGRLRWNLVYKSQAFADGQSAKNAEDEMKARFDRLFDSLGGEFYLGKEDDLASAFFSAASPTAFRITATTRRRS